MSKKREKRKSFVKGKINTWLKESAEPEAIFKQWKKRMYHFARSQESKTFDKKD